MFGIFFSLVQQLQIESNKDQINELNIIQGQAW